MNDHIKPEIQSYLSGGLPESRNRQIEAHAAACEKCRNALAKARTKQARVKREALKHAAADPLPNLFLARQGKAYEEPPPSFRKGWIYLILVVIAVAAVWKYRTQWHDLKTIAVPVETAAAPEPEAPPVTPPPAPKPAAVKAPEPKAPVPPKPPVVLTPLQQWSGPNCAIKESRVVVVRNSEAWKRLLGEIQLTETPAEIDFGSKLVIGIFAGPRPAGATVSLDKISESDDGMYAPYAVSAPAVTVSTATSIAPGSLSHPYWLGVFPRVEKKIKIFSKEN